MCSVVLFEHEDDFHLQTIYYCDESKYSLVDQFGNTVIKCSSINDCPTYIIDDDYKLIKGNIKDKIKDVVLYDDMIKTEGIKFANRYFSLFVINQYTNYCHNIIDNLKKYEIGVNSTTLCDMLFSGHVPKDTINIVNVSLYLGEVGHLMDYINKRHIEEHEEKESDYFHQYSKPSIKTPNINQALREIVGRIDKSKSIPIHNPKTILMSLMNTLSTTMPTRYVTDSVSFNTLKHCISTLSYECPNMSAGYKSAVKCSNYRNFINAFKKDDHKTQKFKDLLLNTNSINNTDWWNLQYYMELVLFKYTILMSQIETKTLTLGYYNQIIGLYINSILIKGTLSRLFPISIQQVTNSLSSFDFVPNPEYIEIRSKLKPTFSVIDTYTMIIDGQKIPGCGESCVYNYINRLLFKDSKIRPELFPMNLRHTKLYQFYNKIFDDTKFSTLTEQNTLIQNENIFNQFAHLLIGIEGVEYTDMVKKVEFIPTAENFTTLLKNLLINEPIDDNFGITKITKMLYNQFHNTYENISYDKDKLTLTIDNISFLMTSRHCATSKTTGFEDIKHLFQRDEFLRNHYIFYKIHEYFRPEEEGDYFDDDYFANKDDYFADNVSLLRLVLDSELFCNRMSMTDIDPYEEDLEIKAIDIKLCPHLLKFAGDLKLSPEIYLEAVKKNWTVLKFIKNQTPEICLEAVKQNGHTLEYVKNQTSEMCLEAVKQDGFVVGYVKNQTPEICLEAVKQAGLALRYVENKTPELCLEAVKQNGLALQYVKNKTPELCLEAVKHNGLALEYVKNQTPEICLEAVEQNGLALEYVFDEFKTPEICLEAVKQNGLALEYVFDEIKTPEICEEAIKQNPEASDFQ